MTTSYIEVPRTASRIASGLRQRRFSGRVSGIGHDVQSDFMTLSDSTLTEIPPDLQVKHALVLQDCQQLVRLPDGLEVGSLNLNRCTALAELPKRLSVSFLDLEDCTSLRVLPDDLNIRGGRLNLRNCAWISTLPDGLGEIAQLDVSGCLNLTSLPRDLRITSWIDIGGSGITSLPDGYGDVGLRWRGVPVPHHVVFEPETLSPDEILTERNAEVRRVMMKRFGYERLMEVANAEVLDTDKDAGGERKLLRIPVPDDEDLVCVAVKCPSTGHQFMLRVPPTMRSCHAAVAWTAGFDDPSA